MFYRYEAMLDNEYMGCGIMQGLDALDLELDEYRFLIRKFNKELPIPTCFAEKPRLKTVSYFTEEGNAFFRKDIDKIIKAYDHTNLFWVRHVIKKTLPTQKIVYQDEYQVVVLLEEE